MTVTVYESTSKAEVYLDLLFEQPDVKSVKISRSDRPRDYCRKIEVELDGEGFDPVPVIHKPLDYQW